MQAELTQELDDRLMAENVKFEIAILNEIRSEIKFESMPDSFKELVGKHNALMVIYVQIANGSKPIDGKIEDKFLSHSKYWKDRLWGLLKGKADQCPECNCFRNDGEQMAKHINDYHP